MHIKINQNILKKFLYIKVLHGTIADNFKEPGSHGTIHMVMEDKNESIGCAVRSSIDVIYKDPDHQIKNSILSTVRKLLDIDATTQIELNNFNVYFLNGPERIDIRCDIKAKGFLRNQKKCTIPWDPKFQTAISNVLSTCGITLK